VQLPRRLTRPAVRNAKVRTGSGHGIHIANVTKRYTGMPRPALHNVSLDVGPGEFLTFLGPSGAGKTTLLSLIAGFAALTEGSIYVDKRNLGVVFQQYALFPHMTVAKNVAFPLEQRGLSRAEIGARVRDVLALVHLDEFADRLPRQLSGGQQQRVALARAVVYQPRALLLDEPLGALDRRLRDELRREIARMHDELRLTFIFVTHDQQEALTLSDRIAVLNEGVLEQVGPPSELYDHPATLFVAQFLGESNVFRGAIDPAARMLRCGAFDLLAPQIDGEPVGRAACVVVRPERLELRTDGDSIPLGDNRVAATVTEVVYVGSHHQVGLRFADGTRGVAMHAVGRALPAVPGEGVMVSWNPQHQAVVAGTAPCS
jgi:putative spermidine/putrescine transport system ATP-binding protein